MACAGYNGWIYCAGGTGDSGGDPEPAVDTFWAYSSAHNQWFTLPSMPQARDSAQAHVIGSKFYVVSGRDGLTNSVVGSTHVYDIASGSWSAAAPPPVARGGYASAVVEGRIVVFSGELSQAGVTASTNWKDAFLYVTVTCIENEGPDNELFGYSQFVDTSWCGLAYPEHLDELDSIMACDMESGRWQTRTAGRDDKAFLLDGIRKATINELKNYRQAVAEAQ